MPSMRLMWVAGEACERDNISAYNCAYVTPANKRTFSEILYVLMNGTGVSFVRANMPASYHPCPSCPRAGTRLSWRILNSDGLRLSESSCLRCGTVIYRELITPRFDQLELDFGPSADEPLVLTPSDAYSHLPSISLIRHKGGGLVQSRSTTLSRLLEKSSCRRCSPGLHSLACPTSTTGSCETPSMVSGGWITRSGRWLTTRLSILGDRARRLFSKSGRRWSSPRAASEIFNRAAAQRQAGAGGRREASLSYGCNPCSEIILRPQQFCNLTEVVVRAEDTWEELSEKVRLATILGTIQSTLTNFPVPLRRVEEEHRGRAPARSVSLTGIYDCALTANPNPDELESLRDLARDTNTRPSSTARHTAVGRDYLRQAVGHGVSARRLSIRYPPTTCCVLHTAYSDGHKDPICEYLKAQGLNYEADSYNPNGAVVFSFPTKAPEGAVTRHNVSAEDHFNLWLTYQRHWTDHKPSCTISVRDSEWPGLGALVYKHFDEVSGISFLPYSDHSYVQAPYEDITEEDLC